VERSVRDWYGSLLLEQQDASGLLYRRNRYYDPQTGQFTQEDPIGIAGGLNLYGYANGDPVNFGDPFGLCTPMPECWLYAQLRGAADAVVDMVSSAYMNTIGRLRPGVEVATGYTTVGADGSLLRGFSQPTGLNLNPATPELSASVSLALELWEPREDGVTTITTEVNTPVFGPFAGVFFEFSCSPSECSATGVGFQVGAGVTNPPPAGLLSVGNINVEMYDLTKDSGGGG